MKNPNKEAAMYCAKTNARLRGTESTWFYYDEDGMVVVTAYWKDGKIRARSKRL